MKKITLLLLAISISLVHAFACINGETQVLKNGTIITERAEGAVVPYGNKYDDLSFPDLLKDLDRLWKRTKDIDYLSDYGLVLLLSKKYEEARDIFLKVESIRPNRYATAANLGTAYELLGKNDSALTWIRKAVAIDPASHKNSEWIHVNILEAKVRGEEFITSEFLLKTSFGTAAKPQSSLTSEELLKLYDALYYQLNERVSFIKQQDKIVAALMFDLGNIALLTDSRELTAIIYERAKAYGFTGPLLQLRIDYLNNKVAATATVLATDTALVKGKESNNYVIWIAVVTASLVALSVIIIRRRNRMES